MTINQFQDRPKHNCWWCGELTDSLFWACQRCSPLKEQGYARAKEAGAKTFPEVIKHVDDVLKENGINRE
jgi:hypothetical protein